MKAISEFFRKFDSFGVPLTFKYKSKEKYTTGIGGIFTLIFVAIAIFLGVYNFIPFYNKKNFTTIYYVLKLAETEQIYFDKSKVAFSIGLNCWTGSDGTKADDLFDVFYKYIYWDFQDGEWVRKTDNLGTHQCTYTDFYNDFNKSFYESGVYNYKCLDDLSRPLEGIYTSSVFSYYEFDVYAKNNSKELLDKIEKYLIENDCKFQIYYIDKTIDIDDYKDPIKSYLETDFIQINPTLSIRRNMYFMNQHLYDDDSFISLMHSPNDEETELSSLYSRYEEYSLFQGLNRTNASSDYLNWVKLFFRADTRKTDVKRQYQNIMEFYADASSLLIAFYEILLIIFYFINTFYAELSLSKKLFFFKEINENNININKYSSRINTLLSQITEESNIQNIQNFHCRFNNNKRKISPSSNVFSDNSNNIENNYERNSSKKSISKIEILSINKYDLRSESNEPSNDKLRTQKLQTDNISYKNSTENIFNNKKKKEIDKVNKKEETANVESYVNIKYNFNIFEIICTSFCKCCLIKNLGIKNNIKEKANNILDNSLDVVSYIRNIFLFDIINVTIMDENIKSIVNFLCRPIISINNDNKNEFADFYRSYEETDFDKFCKEIKQLAQKPKKKIKEKKLIMLSNKQLKNFLINNT